MSINTGKVGCDCCETIKRPGDPFTYCLYQEGGSGGFMVPHFWDPELGTLVSANITWIEFGRQSAAYIGWLRAVGLARVDLAAAGHGYQVPRDASIVLLVTQHDMSGAPVNCNLQIAVNTATVYTDPYLSNGTKTMRLDVNQGDRIRCRTTLGGIPSSGPDNPWVRMGLRWRGCP